MITDMGLGPGVVEGFSWEVEVRCLLVSDDDVRLLLDVDERLWYSLPEVDAVEHVEDCLRLCVSVSVSE